MKLTTRIWYISFKFRELVQNKELQVFKIGW